MALANFEVGTKISEIVYVGKSNCELSVIFLRTSNMFNIFRNLVTLLPDPRLWIISPTCFNAIKSNGRGQDSLKIDPITYKADLIIVLTICIKVVWVEDNLGLTLTQKR